MTINFKIHSKISKNQHILANLHEVLLESRRLLNVKPETQQSRHIADICF